MHREAMEKMAARLSGTNCSAWSQQPISQQIDCFHHCTQ